MQQLVGMFDENDFIQDTLRLSMVSFSEPDKVVHHFPFTSTQSKSEILKKINETEYHSKQFFTCSVQIFHSFPLWPLSLAHDVL